MARLGRAHPIPAKRVGGLRYSRASLDLPAFEIPTEWPPLDVVTPNVNLFLAAFEIPTEWPALTLNRDQLFTLAAFEIPTEWPALSVVIPPRPGDAMTGADGEIEFNGTVWGGGQSLYRVTELEGWEDLPGIDSGNVERPSRHGSYSGRKYAQERVVTATVLVDDNTDTWPQSFAALRAATAIGRDDTEYPLVIRLRGETLLASGSITGRIVPTGLIGAGIAQVSVRWTCSDPRRYSIDLQGSTVPLNTDTDLANVGNVETHPMIRLPGPLTGPVLVNTTLERTLEFDLEVEAGQTLDIDTDNATVSINGVSQMSHLTGSSVPVGDFVLADGTNTIHYSTSSGGGGADFLWRHAYL